MNINERERKALGAKYTRIFLWLLLGAKLYGKTSNITTED
jgi:hypothetical protein